MPTDPKSAPAAPPPVWLPALVATLLAVALGMWATHLYMARQIVLHPQRFNVYPLPDKLLGLALQRQAFLDATLLPVYGSSELTQPQRNRADDFFRAQPTGFGAFLIGNPGETSLMITTKIAAANPTTVHGHRAVVFLSPGWFVAPELDHPGFGVNFSPLHGGVFAFDSELTPGLRRDLARRLLDYPDIIAKYPLIKAGLSCLAANTPAQRVLRTLVSPLGAVHNRVQRELDYLRLGLWLWQNGPRTTAGTSAGLRHPERIDWDVRLRETAAQSDQRPLGSPYSVAPASAFDARALTLFRDPNHPERTPDEIFARKYTASKEWADYRLLLRTARELKINLLVICQPINARFSDLQGVSPQAREGFYQRLRDETAAFRTPLLTFPADGEDPHNFQDASHPTALMWLNYDRLLDAFYHQPPKSELR